MQNIIRLCCHRFSLSVILFVQGLPSWGGWEVTVLRGSLFSVKERGGFTKKFLAAFLWDSDIFPRDQYLWVWTAGREEKIADFRSFWKTRVSMLIWYDRAELLAFEYFLIFLIGGFFSENHPSTGISKKNDFNSHNFLRSTNWSEFFD